MSQSPFFADKFFTDEAQRIALIDHFGDQKQTRADFFTVVKPLVPFTFDDGKKTQIRVVVDVG